MKTDKEKKATKATATTVRAHDDLPIDLLWLKDMCAGEDDPTVNERSPAHHVFVEEFEGAQWYVASEGHVLVAVKVHEQFKGKYTVENLLNQNARAKRVGNFAERYLSPAHPSHMSHVGSTSTDTDYQRWRAWIDISMLGKCPLCRGTGKDEQLEDEEVVERLDLFIESSEQAICQGLRARHGRVLGRKINRNLIVEPTAYLLAKTITIETFKGTDDNEPVLIYPTGDLSFGDWRVLVMPTKDDGSPCDTFDDGFTINPAAASSEALNG